MSTWVLISSLDAPTAGVFDFPSLTLTSYSAVQVIGSGITVTTDGTDIKLTVYQGGSEVTGRLLPLGDAPRRLERQREHGW
jgi:hypothetical protein